jgi:hypothetical protein
MACWQTCSAGGIFLIFDFLTSRCQPAPTCLPRAFQFVGMTAEMGQLTPGSLTPLARISIRLSLLAGYSSR